MKAQKNENHYWILHIQLSLRTDFQLNWQLRFFRPNFPKKVAIFSLKQINTTIEFCILKLVLVSIFTLNIFDFLDQFCLRKIFMVKSRKSEHRHWILLIPTSLGTKIQLKLTILIFLTRFTQKGFFWSKTEKAEHQVFSI